MILGIMGTISSGKTSLSLMFEEKGFQYISDDEIVLENLFDLEPYPENIQMIRKKILERNPTERIESIYKMIDSPNFVVDGIYSKEEIDYMRGKENFYLIGLDRDVRTRYLRWAESVTNVSRIRAEIEKNPNWWESYESFSTNEMDVKIKELFPLSDLNLKNPTDSDLEKIVKKISKNK